jgi:hypothetical protein
MLNALGILVMVPSMIKRRLQLGPGNQLFSAIGKAPGAPTLDLSSGNPRVLDR